MLISCTLARKDFVRHPVRAQTSRFLPQQAKELNPRIQMPVMRSKFIFIFFKTAAAGSGFLLDQELQNLHKKKKKKALL